MFKGILVFLSLSLILSEKNNYFLRHRYQACENFHCVRYGWSNVVLLPWSPWHTFSCVLSLISGLSSFLCLNPKHNPNPKESSKIWLIVRLTCPADGWCRPSPFRGALRFMAAVPELCLFCCCSTVMLWPFSEKREGHVTLLYFPHSFAGVGFFLSDPE